MSIQAIPLAAAACISPDASALDALQHMLTHRINHVPVCDEQGFCGLIGVNDILRELIPVSARMPHGLTDLKFAGNATSLLVSHLHELKTKPARELVNKDIPTLDDSCPLLEAALLLTKHPTPLPVKGADGKLRGMLSRRALLAYLMQEPRE